VLGGIEDGLIRRLTSSYVPDFCRNLEILRILDSGIVNER
jgi:hypothetical protein